MNILIIGKPFKELIREIQNSKFEYKIFTAGDVENEEFPNISYSTFDELIKKSAALKIDIAINLEKRLVEQDITTAFKNSKINLISVNKKWLNLETNPLAAKQLLEHYSINTPKRIKTPLNFPISMINSSKMSEKKINSITELTNVLENEKGNIFYEEYTDGEPYNLSAIWDGKNIMYLTKPPENEVKSDRLDLLKTKLTFMFSDEKADFAGFFTIKLIWTKNDWYVKGFKMNFDEKSLPKDLKQDFIFILHSIIYGSLGNI